MEMQLLRSKAVKTENEEQDYEEKMAFAGCGDGSGGMFAY